MDIYIAGLKEDNSFSNGTLVLVNLAVNRQSMFREMVIIVNQVIQQYHQVSLINCTLLIHYGMVNSVMD